MVAQGGWAAKAVVRYTLKYGPLVFEAVKHGREPAERAIRRALTQQADRRRAFEHAKTLVDGSVLRAFYNGQPIWVVFSGDVPVTAYPPDVVELAVLLEHADLDQRIRPSEAKASKGRKLPKLPKLSNLPKPSDVPRKLSDVPRKLSTLPRRIPRSPWRK